MRTIAAPHPSPARPSFRLPPGACDAHCHVFGPVDRFPYAADRHYTPPEAPAETLTALHKHLGIQRAVLVQASAHGTDNRAMLDAIARDPQKRRGVAMLPANASDTELLRLHAGGVRGVRYNFVRHLGGPPAYSTVERMARRISPLGWHLVLHLDAADLVGHGPFLRALPVPFVIDHMGRVSAGDGLAQPAFERLLALLGETHAWVKVSGPERVSSALGDYADAVPFAAALIRQAPDRVLWGTDWPHPNVREMPDDGALVDLLPRMAPDPLLRQRLLVDNPLRLYWGT
jgi:predicted TIM-barrel fold metal-dependent hydrolase